MSANSDELSYFHDAINNDPIIVITPDIITLYTVKLKPGKDDCDISFKSDHLIHGGHQLHVMLS